MPSVRLQTPNETPDAQRGEEHAHAESKTWVQGHSDSRQTERTRRDFSAMGEDSNGSTHRGSGGRALLRRSYPCAKTGTLCRKMFVRVRSCLSSRERPDGRPFPPIRTRTSPSDLRLGSPTRIPTSDFRYRIPTRPSDPGYRDSVTFKSILRPIASAKKADPCQASKLPPMAKTSPCSPSCTRSGETRAVT